MKQEIGYQQEEIDTLYLKKGNLEVVIKMIKSNNLIHTISVECKAVRKKNKKG